jgi:hypothetical protein
MSGKVWKLSPQKAAILEQQFKQKGGVLIHSDSKFYGVDEWQRILPGEEVQVESSVAKSSCTEGIF